MSAIFLGKPWLAGMASIASGKADERIRISQLGLINSLYMPMFTQGTAELFT